MNISVFALLAAGNLLSLASQLLVAAMLLQMEKTGFRKELPMFWTYLTFAFLQSTFLFPMRLYFGYWSSEYFLGYWLLKVVDITLVFLVIHEVYAKALHRYDGLRTLCRAIFSWAAVVLIIVGAVSVISSGAADRDSMYSYILLVDRGALIVQFGLVVLLLILASSLSLGWRECTFGVAAGMCFYCTMQLVAISLRTHGQNSVAEVFAVLRPLIGVATLGIWTVYVFRSERARIEVTSFKSDHLEQWNTAVLLFLNR